MKPIIAAILLALLPASAAAQAYPTRTVTIIVPFSAGGTTDVLARILAQRASQSLKQQVIVENVTGAGGTLGSARVARATPDGYTAVMGNLGTHAASVGLYAKRLAYDPRTDFEPVILFAGTPMLVLAKKDLPVADFASFVDWLRRSNGKATFGSGGVGATSHLTCLFLHSLLKVEAQHIPYRGSGPAMNDLISGQIDYVCDQTVAAVPQVQAGTVRGIVAAVPERLKSAPAVPSAPEAGLPAFEAVGWNALFLPKGTPRPVVDRLNAAAREALDDEAILRRLDELGAIPPAPEDRTPEALGLHVRREVDKWLPIIEASGATAE